MPDSPFPGPVEGRWAKLTPGQPVRLIQVGAGGMGKTWLRNIADDPDVELVGLVDLDQTGARAAAEEAGFGGVPIGGSLTSLLQQGIVTDAVINVTVPKAHLPVNTEALLAGLPVLCEKPLADTVAEGLQMIATVEQTGQLLMISQSRRYWRHLFAYKKQLAQLGTIGSVSCEFFKAPHFGGFRDEMDYPLLIDMAIHQFDLARFLLDADPVAVYAESYNPSWSWYSGDAGACVIFEFSTGARFTFTGSWCAAGAETSWNGAWRVSAADGSALWDGDHAPTAETAAGDALPAEIGEEPEQIAGSLVEFIDALRTGVVPQGEVHDNLLSLAMVEAAIRSAESGSRVLIADILHADPLQAATSGNHA